MLVVKKKQPIPHIKLKSKKRVALIIQTFHSLTAANKLSNQSAQLAPPA